MFPNLEAEMAREKISIKKLSELTDINYETLKLKLRGVTEFKLGEMLSIKRKVFANETLDYLFATEEGITWITPQRPCNMPMVSIVYIARFFRMRNRLEESSS